MYDLQKASRGFKADRGFHEILDLFRDDALHGERVFGFRVN